MKDPLLASADAGTPGVLCRAHASRSYGVMMSIQSRAAIRVAQGSGLATLLRMTQRSPFRYLRTSPEIIRLAVRMYAGFPLSLRNVEDLPQGRGIEVSYESVRFWR